MAQIQGTCNLTQGSNAVVGIGSTWLASIQVGWIFVSLDGLPYFVASITDNTHLTLTAPYAGASASGAAYGVVTGYSPKLSLPLIGINDMDAAALISKSLCMVEQAISAAQNGLVFQGNWNAETNTPAIPAGAPGNANWEYVVSVAGTTSINGFSAWAVGDFIRSNGSSWSHIPGTLPNAATLQNITDTSGTLTYEGNEYATAASLEAIATSLATLTNVLNSTLLPSLSQITPAMIAFLTQCSTSNNLPVWNGGTWPGSSGSTYPAALCVADTSNGLDYNIIVANGQLETVQLASGAGTPVSVIIKDSTTSIYYQVSTVNGGIATVQLASGTVQNNILSDSVTGENYQIIIQNGALGVEGL